MSSFQQQKITQSAKKQESMAHIQQEKRQLIETVPEEASHWTYERKTLNQLF